MVNSIGSGSTKRKIPEGDKTSSKKQKTDTISSSATALATTAIGNAALAASSDSAAASSASAHVIKNPTYFDEFIQVMPRDVITLILSYLALEHLELLGSQLSVSNPTGCIPENAQLLTTLIKGYQSTPAKIVDSPDSAKAAVESTYVYSPVLTSQLSGYTSLYYIDIVAYDRNGLPIDRILKLVGKNLVVLELGDFSIPSDIDPNIKFNMIKQFIQILNIAGEHCRHLKELSLPNVTDEIENVDDIEEAVRNNIGQWVHLETLSIPASYTSVIRALKGDKIISLSVYDHQDSQVDDQDDEDPSDFFVAVGEKCPNLESLVIYNYGGRDEEGLGQLGAKCPNLHHLFIEFQDEEEEEEVVGLADLTNPLCQLIKTCPITNVHLQGVLCTPKLLKALTGSGDLDEATLEIGCQDLLTKDMLMKFFRANSHLQCFDAGNYACDKWYNVFLAFIFNNEYLRDLSVCFGSHDAESTQISNKQLQAFIDSCEMMSCVTINLENWRGGLPTNFENNVKRKYPNVILKFRETEDVVAEPLTS